MRCQAEATCSWAGAHEGEGQSQDDGGEQRQQQPPGVAAEAPVGQPGGEEPGKGGRVVERARARPASRRRPPGCPAGAAERRQHVAHQVLAEGAVGRVAGIAEAGQRVEAVAGLDPDDARAGAGVDVQLGGQGDLGAQHARGARPPPWDPRRPGRRGCRAGRGPAGPGPAANASTVATSFGWAASAAPWVGAPPLASSSRQSPLKTSTPGPVQASMAWATSVAARVDAGVASLVRCSSLTTSTRPADRDADRHQVGWPRRSRLSTATTLRSYPAIRRPISPDRGAGGVLSSLP